VTIISRQTRLHISSRSSTNFNVFAYCKRLNFHKDLNFANHLRFVKNRSREQLGNMSTLRKLCSICEN
ncbi:MAG: hypothetical protein PV344_05550, partial [Anaplasma sp.]|nr:hypothetical protein [Anaplasma sp.]